jgi:hypothetical protein
LAVLVADLPASDAGTVRARVPAWLLDAAPVPEIVLVGRVSGAFSIRQPPILPAP